jgi:hypothetical protein
MEGSSFQERRESSLAHDFTASYFGAWIKVMGLFPSAALVPGGPAGGTGTMPAASDPDEDFLDALSRAGALKVMQGLAVAGRPGPNDADAYLEQLAGKIRDQLTAVSEHIGRSAVTMREGGGTVMERGLRGALDAFLSSQPVGSPSSAALVNVALTSCELILGAPIEQLTASIAGTLAPAPEVPDPSAEESDTEPPAPHRVTGTDIYIPDWLKLAPAAYRSATTWWQEWYEVQYGKPDPRFLPPLGQGNTKIGAWVERQIRALYISQFPTHVVLSDTLLYPGTPPVSGADPWIPVKDVDLDRLGTPEARAILAALVNPRTNRRRKPDLCDFTSRETYEIKPFGALTKGLKQLVEVLWLLDLRYFIDRNHTSAWPARELSKKFGRKTVQAVDTATQSFVHAFDLAGNPGQDPAQIPFFRPGIWHPALEVIYPGPEASGLRIVATVTVPGLIGYGRASESTPVDWLRRALEEIIGDLAARLLADAAEALANGIKPGGGGDKPPAGLPPGSRQQRVPPAKPQVKTPADALGLGGVRGSLVESLRQQQAMDLAARAEESGLIWALDSMAEANAAVQQAPFEMVEGFRAGGLHPSESLRFMPSPGAVGEIGTEGNEFGAMGKLFEAPTAGEAVIVEEPILAL